MKNIIITITSVFFIIAISIGYLGKEEKSKLVKTSVLNSSQLEKIQNENVYLKKKVIELKEVENPYQILPSTIIFDIPKYKQTYTASCEAAAVYAATKYLDGNLTEDQILNDIGRDDSPRYFDSEGNLHWGNPQMNFVGNFNAKSVYVDGYGVYNEPIYKVLSANGFSKSISKNAWNTGDLYDEIKKGNPIVVWISNDYKKQDVGTMIAADGTKNLWMNREHTVVIRGVDNDNVYVMDVGGGDYQTITKNQFETGFANLNNMAIVVIKD